VEPHVREGCLLADIQGKRPDQDLKLRVGRDLD